MATLSVWSPALPESLLFSCPPSCYRLKYSWNENYNQTNKWKKSVCALWFTAFGCVASTLENQEGRLRAGVLPMSQYNMIFEMPARYLANTSTPSVPISATINWHCMEHTARLENLSPETFSSRAKCRNYTDYTGNLTQDRNKISAVTSVKSGQKILLKLFAWARSPREAEVLGTAWEIWDPSVVTQLENKEGWGWGSDTLADWQNPKLTPEQAYIRDKVQ